MYLDNTVLTHYQKDRARRLMKEAAWRREYEEMYGDKEKEAFFRKLDRERNKECIDFLNKQIQERKTQ